MPKAKKEEVKKVVEEIVTEQVARVLADVDFLNSDYFIGMDESSKRIECDKIRSKEDWVKILEVTKKWLI